MPVPGKHVLMNNDEIAGQNPLIAHGIALHTKDKMTAGTVA
jgi:hypothetical protein